MTSSIHLVIIVHLEDLLEATRHDHDRVLLASEVTINPRIHTETTTTATTTAEEMEDLGSITERDSTILLPTTAN